MASATGNSGSSLSTHSARRIDYLVYLFILFEGCLYWVLCQRVEDIAPDSSTYQGLAQSLRNFGTFHFNFAPHIQYPPGLPLLLAGVASVFGDDHHIYLRAMAVTATLGLWVTYAFLKQEEGRPVAAAGTLLLGASVYFFTYATTVLNSDVPYLLASLAALVLGKQMEKSNPPLRRLALSAALAFLLVYSVLVRSAGIALVGGFCLWLALSFAKSRRIPTRLLAIFGPPIALGVAAQAAWWLYVQQVKAQALPAWGGAYADVFRLVDPRSPELGYASVGDLLLRIPGNLVQHSAHLFEFGSGLDWIDQRWYSPFVLLTMGLVAWGFAASVRRRQGPVECYFLLYAIVYSLWPYDVGARFVLPIFPIAFLYAWRATQLLWNIASKQPGRFAFGAFAFCIVVGSAALVTQWHAGSPSSTQARIAPFFWLTASAAFAAIGYWHARSRGSAVTISGTAFLRRPMTGFQRVPALAQSIGILLLVLLVVKGIIDQKALGLEYLKSRPSDITHNASVEAARWIKAHALESDIVMAQQLPVVHYVSGHRVVGFPPTTNARQIMEAIRSSGVTYLVVITSTATGSNILPPEIERLHALQAAYGETFQVAHADAGYQVFRIAGTVSRAAADR